MNKVYIGYQDDNVAKDVVDFFASRSSGVYGKSSTIQMAALVTRPFIKY